MRRSTQGLFLTLSLVLGASAFAANERRHKPSEFQEVTDEDRAAAKARARSPVGTWKESEGPPEYHFPWMQIGFVVLALGIAVPFGWSAYNRHAKEHQEAEAGALAPAPRKRTKTAE